MFATPIAQPDTIFIVSLTSGAGRVLDSQSPNRQLVDVAATTNNVTLYAGTVAAAQGVSAGHPCQITVVYTVPTRSPARTASPCP